MAGRPKKPTKLKILEGTYREDRANKNEATPDPGIPEMPEHLSEGAKEEWEKMSVLLCEDGLISPIDKACLSMYCSAWDRVARYEKIVAKDGELKETKNGNEILNPAMWVLNKAQDQLNKYYNEIGACAAARGKVTALKVGKGTNKFTKYKKKT